MEILYIFFLALAANTFSTTTTNVVDHYGYKKSSLKQLIEKTGRLYVKGGAQTGPADFFFAPGYVGSYVLFLFFLVHFLQRLT